MHINSFSTEATIAMALSNWLTGLETVAAFGGLGVFLDFYIGKEGQKRLKGRLEHWWLAVSEIRWSNFGREEGLYALTLIDNIFGPRFFSLKRLRTCFAMTLIVAVGVFLGNLNLYLRDIRAADDDILRELFLQGGLRRDLSLTSLLSLTYSNLLFSLGISVTRYFTTKIIAHNRLNFAWFVLLLMFSYVMLCFWPLLVAFGVKVFAQTASGSLDLRTLWGLIQLTAYFIGGFTLQWPKTVVETYVLAYHSAGSGIVSKIDLVLALAPSAFRFIVALIFLTSYLMVPLKDVFLTFWSRVIDSDQPFFTLILGGLAAIAKCFEEVVKAFN
jgi:hypothetical protein